MLTYLLTWYPRLWLPSFAAGNISNLPQPLNDHMMYVQSASKRLARYTFHQMVKYQQKSRANKAFWPGWLMSVGFICHGIHLYLRRYDDQKWSKKCR